MPCTLAPSIDISKDISEIFIQFFPKLKYGVATWTWTWTLKIMTLIGWTLLRLKIRCGKVEWNASQLSLTSEQVKTDLIHATQYNMHWFHIVRICSFVFCIDCCTPKTIEIHQSTSRPLLGKSIFAIKLKCMPYTRKIDWIEFRIHYHHFGTISHNVVHFLVRPISK